MMLLFEKLFVASLEGTEVSENLLAHLAQKHCQRQNAKRRERPLVCEPRRSAEEIKARCLGRVRTGLSRQSVE